MKSVSVDPERFAAALSILDREERENPLSGDDRKFKWLNRIGYGFVIVASLVGTFWSFWGLLGLKESFWYVAYVFVWTSILFIPFHGTTFAIMIRLNWRLVRAVRRQERMVEKLGLAGALEAPWAGERAKKRVLNLVTLLVGPGLWGWGLFFMVVVVLLPLPELPEKAPAFLFPVPRLEERAPVAWAVFLCFLWTLLIGYMYVWLHRLRRGEERLRVVARLQSSLRGLKKSAAQPDKVQIAGDEYNQIARIEQAQISRARADSVESFASAAEPTFVVQKSHSVRTAQLKLDPGVGLQVQDAIESLAAGARGRNATSGEAANLRWLKVPETTLEIGYSIDEAARRLRVVSLRPVADGQGATPERTT
jgi:hypothetical protein